MADDAELAFVATMRDEASAAARQVRRAIESVGGKARPIVQEYEVDVDNARAQLADIRDSGDGASTSLANVGNALTKAGAVGPAVMALGSALSAAAAGAVALGGAVGPAAVAGVGAYAGVMLAAKTATAAVSFAMEGLSEAASGNEEAMKDLTPPARDFARQLKALQPEVKGIRSALQSSMFAGFGSALERVTDEYLPLFRTAARETGTAIGDLADRASHLVSTSVFRNDFATIASANAGNIGLMGDAGLQLADAVRSLLVESLPLTRRFLEWSVGAAGAFNTFVQGKRRTGELAAFFDHAGDVAAQLGRILGDVGSAVGNVFAIGASTSGQGMLDTVERIADGFREWTESAAGFDRISAWFRQGQDNLGAMGRLLRDASSGLSGLGSGAQLAPLVDQLRTEVLPPLLEFLSNASVSGALSSLVSAIGDVAGVFATLAENDGSMRSFADALGEIARAIQWVLDEVPGAQSVLSAFFTMLGIGLALKVTGLLGLARSIAGVGASALAGVGHVSNLAAGFRSADAAADASTGKMGVLGGSLRNLASATGSAIKGAVTWAAQTAAAAARATAAMVASVARQVAAWIMLGARSLASAARVALAWVISMGPIALVIAAVIGLVVVIVKNWDKIKRVILAAVSAIRGGLAKAWGAIRSGVVSAWNAVRGAISKAWDAIKGAVTKSVNAVKASVTNAWNAIKSAVGRVLDGIKSLIVARWNAVKTLTSAAFNALKGIVSRAWDAVKNAVSQGITRAVDLVRGLGGKVKSAVGNLGSILWDTGASIIRGLINGIESALGALRDKLGSVTNLIPDWKGPMDVDRRLLTPSGQAIMGGLIAGIADEERSLRSELATVTDLIASSVNPDLGALAADARAASLTTLVRSSEVYTIRHEIVSPDGSVSDLTAAQVADLIARDPKSARRLETVLRPARRRNDRNTISSSD